VTAPYSYDGMLDPGSKYVCANCESTFEDDHYVCPVCGTLTLERLPATRSDAATES
jgi:rRNA maturation endonuclease Nob1